MKLTRIPLLRAFPPIWRPKLPSRLLPNLLKVVPLPLLWLNLLSNPLLRRLRTNRRTYSRYTFRINIIIHNTDKFSYHFQLAQQRQQQQQAPPAAGAAAGGIDINAMRESPQIQQLREMIRQNPALMQPLIQQLAASNPGIAQAVAQNPEALFQLLGSGEDGEGGALPPGTQFVNVTAEEQAAIERVSDL